MTTSHENFDDFIERINSFQKYSFNKSADNFSLNPSAIEKVDENGGFKPFFGDTVIFDLAPEVKRHLAAHQNRIYEIAGDYLSEKINPDTFHMTLHDLSVFPEDVAVDSSPYYKKVYELVHDMNSSPNEYPADGGWPYSIDMEPMWIFNMNNTSIVYGLRAADEQNHRYLMKMYRAFDDIVPLPYPFTPHFTLAYYKRSIPAEIMLKLAHYAASEHGERFFITLRRNQLMYCRFTSMNNYERIV